MHIQRCCGPFALFLQHAKAALYLPYFSQLPYFRTYLPYFFLDRSQNQLQLPYIFADALFFFTIIDMHITIVPMAIPVIYTLQLEFTHWFSIPFLVKCKKFWTLYYFNVAMISEKKNNKLLIGNSNWCYTSKLLMQKGRKFYHLIHFHWGSR